MPSQQNPAFTRLEQTYKKWQEMVSKGQLKMKMKIAKDKKQYYDFDFSHYQYYYNYPQNHFAFLPPNCQKQLLQAMLHHLLQTDVELFEQRENTGHAHIDSDTVNHQQSPQHPNINPYFDYQQQYTNQFFHHLKPYELQHFLHDYITRITRKVISLRIKKSILTPKKVKELFKNSQYKPQTESVVQLIETQIRTYVSKLNRLEGSDFQFGKDLTERLQDTKSHLKASERDQLHFAPLDKSDFVIYERLMKVEQKLLYPMRCAQYEATMVMSLKSTDIEKKAYLRALDSLKQIEGREKEQFESRRQKLMSYFGQKEPFFLEEFSNLASIDAFLKSLSYLDRLSSFSSKGCLNIHMHYKDVFYIPQNKLQTQKYARQVCAEHFAPALINQLISPEQSQSYSEEHLCYKVIKLASTAFRISLETYDLTFTFQDSDIRSKKVIMKRELQTVFAHDLDKLLNLPQHEAITVVGNEYENGYQIDELENSVGFELEERQLIFHQYFQEYEFRDPFLNAFVNLLFSRKEKNFHDLIEEYTSYLKQKQIFSNKLKHLVLFYNNMHSDPKNHLINIINSKLSLAQESDPNPNFTKFLTILKSYSQIPTEEVPLKLLNSLYFLRLITTYLNKNKLMTILNGQVNIMLKAKNRLKFFKRKANLKFELSNEFVTRYTETNQKKDDPFDFVRNVETLDDCVSYEIPSDKLFIDEQKCEVSVKRTNPQNPLFEGKKIIYQQAIQETEQLIKCMVALGSKMIEKRENYLHGEELTQIVDRVELLYQLVDDETQYQMAKLQLMKEYSEILEGCICPSGIESITHKLYRLKREQFSMSLNQNSFHQQYEHLRDNFKLRTRVLQQLKEMLIKTELNETMNVKNGLIRKNFNHLSPELSSIYYTEGSKVEEDIQEQEESEQEKEISLIGAGHPNDSDSKSQAHQNSFLETSQFSSRHSYKHSDYHVKKTFKEILALNQTSNIKNNMQKKEQLLNRKKKRVLNDTVLGKLLNYDLQQKHNPRTDIKFSEHLHNVEMVMKSIEKEFESNPKYAKKSVQNVALEEIIQEYSTMQSRNIQLEDRLSEELLPMSLHDCSKMLSKLVQKIKTQPNGIEHSSSIDPLLIEQVFKNMTCTDQVNPYRGLYIALNHVQMQELLFQNSLTKYRQEKIKSQLNSLITNYSSLKLNQDNEPILLMPTVLENHINSHCRLLGNLNSKNQLHLISFGQYNTYAKLIFLLDDLLADFYEKLILHLVTDNVYKFESLCTELELLAKGNAWIGNGSTNRLNEFTRIQNKVWLSKKLETLNGFKKNLLYKETLIDFLHFPLKLVSQTLTQIFKDKKLNEPQQVIDASHQFKSYLQDINLLCSKVIILNFNLHEKFRLKERILQLQDYLKILPHLKEKIVVNREDQSFFKEVFAEELSIKKQPLKTEQDQTQLTTLMNFSMIKLKPSFISILLQPLASFTVSSQALFIFQSLTKRQYLQFKSPKQVQNKRRATLNANQKYFGISNPFPLPKQEFMCVVNSVQSLQMEEYLRVSKILNLIETKLLLFGFDLSSNELVKLRMLLQDKTQNFSVFWKDETSSLMQAKEFVRLRNFRLEANDILQRYKSDYLSFANLKTKYKTMVQKLSEVDLENELEDSIYLLVNYMYFVGLEGHVKKLANPKQSRLDAFKFLYEFGNEIQRPDVVKDFFNCVLKEKLCIKTVLKEFSFLASKKILWGSEVLSSKLLEFRQFEQRNKYLRFHVNNLKRKHERGLKSDLLHFRLQKFLLTNILQNTGIETYSHRQTLEIFSKNFRQQVYEKAVVLSPKEKHLLDLSSQSSDSKSKMELLKDEAFESIYFIKYFYALLVSRVFELTEGTLAQQVELKRLLGDSFEQRQMSKDNHIINESLNRVLAPKVMLNPFLNSPLLPDNYFFAGALKLSYVDQFLNKLKNRAIMVELAQGGFGFLLKVAEIDQSVNALCKGIISFSEKEFNDRLRTYFEYTHELEESLTKTKQENQYLRLLNKLHAFYDEKEIKALVYEKLHSYIECITEKDKNYHNLFAVLKNMENTVMKQCSQKYENRIQELENENQLLKQTFKDFSHKMKHSALSSVNESRDKLYHEFKEKTEKILSKQFIPEYDQLEKHSFEQVEAYESGVLLDKLKQQSIVSRLKSTVVVSQYEKRIHQLEKQLEEKQKTIKDLMQEKQKNAHLMHEVNFLANKAIEVQALQKQRKIDQQERMMEKFKLIRINQSLQGKLSRIQNPKVKQQSGRQNFSRETILGRDTVTRRSTLMERDVVIKSESKIGKQSRLGAQQSLFITKEGKKRSHTQFGTHPTSNPPFKAENCLRNRIKKKRSVLTRPEQVQVQLPLQTQYQMSKLQYIDQARVWREKWQKSESKYQVVARQVKALGENYRLTKNGKRVGERMVELMGELWCEGKERVDRRFG